MYVKYHWFTIILFSTHDKRMKKKQIGKQCYIASLIGRFIFASDQLTTAWLFLKAVIYANCEKHIALQSNHNLWS